MDSQGPAPQVEGQTAEPQAAPGTTQTAPDTGTGQAPATQVQGQAQPAPADEPTFFDPTTLSAELMPAYKQMQAAFTKKMQGLSTDRQKVDLYNRFETDTQFQAQVLQQLAQQHGYTLTKGQAQQMVQQAQQDGAQDWQPQTWQEVMDRAQQLAEERIMQRLSPWLQTVQKVQAGNIEAQLSKLDPNWRVYEDDMQANLRQHPSLVNDVAKLYRLSVPDEVWQAKATQDALKRLEGKAKAAQVGDKSTTSRSAPAPRQAKTFQEAVEIAKEQLKGR